MIEKWLERFESAWQRHDIEGIISLFRDDVEYWENPYTKLDTINKVRSEWAAINNQFDITITTSILLQENGTYVIQWILTYKNESLDHQYWAGIYLIRLDGAGKCSYFYQVGEKNTFSGAIQGVSQLDAAL